MAARDWISHGLDLLLPHRCAGCGVLIERVGFCPGCRATLEALPACWLADLGGPARICVAPAHNHGGALASAIHRFKYHGALHLQRPLAELLCADVERGIDLLVAVPLARARLRQRGYNQAALLAESLARRLDKPHRTDLLLRTRATPAQVGLGRSQRFSNLRDAFVARRPLEGQSVLLVDDVLTSGATSGACALALLDAGAGAVALTVVSRAPLV